MRASVEVDGEEVSFEMAMLLAALKDVHFLLELYKNSPFLESPKVNLRFLLENNYNALTRVSIIALVSAWETYIEVALRSALESILESSDSIGRVQKSLNALAQAWYDQISKSSPKGPKPTDFISWTGVGWKKLLLDKFEEEIANLNTPSSKNIKRLSEKYLGGNICESWTWESITPEIACQKLDNLITLRGDLTHKSEGIWDDKIVSQEEVSDALNLIENLSRCTEKALDS